MIDIESHCLSGQPPEVRFIQLAPASRTPPPAPAFLFGPANRIVFNELFAQGGMHAVGCYVLRNAVVGPTGVAIKDGVAFSSAAFIHPPHHVRDITGRLFKSELTAHHVRGPLAVIYGPGHETFGHWLVDFLPRLHVLHQAGFDIMTMRFVVPPTLTRFAADLLARLGIRQSQLVHYRYWREAIHTDLLVMPTGLRANNRLSPLFAAATAFWTAALHRAASGAPRLRRVFVSRAGAPGARVLTNRDAIERAAQRRGYGIVRPEAHSLTDQVGIFAGARVIVGEYGSALHGSVYAPPGAVVVGLRGALRHPSFVQSGIGEALAQPVGYVLGRTQGDVEQRFAVQPEDFERALDIVEHASRI